MSKGYTGISFPFRIGNKGGVVLSSTDRYSVPHIIESMEQILGTKFRERVMELSLGSDIDSQIFEPNNESTHGLIKYQIVQALEEQEPRIEVTTEGINIINKEEELIAEIDFVVVSYQSNYQTTIRIGGGEDEN